MATTAVLSALSFWQATRFAEDDVERRERARVAATEMAEDARHVRALIGFDLDLTTSFCAATTERDAALFDLLAANQNDARPYVNSLVAQTLRVQNLWSLLQADYPATACATGEGGATGDADAYSVDRAHERLVAFDRTLVTGDSARVAATPERTANESERRLMVAAVAFAMALLLLTASDLASHRGHTARGITPVVRLGRWAMAWGALALAVGALGIALVVSEIGPLGTAVWFVAIVVGLVAGLGLSWLAVRIAGVVRRLRHAGGGRDERERIRWWAELVGAVTLVGFAATALGLSTVSARERDTRAEADRQSVVAERLLDEGEQAALHDLSTVSDLAELDAREAAANQSGLDADASEADRIGAAREAAATHARGLEPLNRSQLDAIGGLASTPEGSCDVEETSSDPGPSPDELLASFRTDATVFSSHVVANAEAGTVCTVLASATRSTADRWNRRGATLTVALVILGLGGFLLALAADPDRSPGPARWMLCLGIVGVLAGGGVALSVPIAEARNGNVLHGERALEFSAHVAAGQTALARGDCETARTQLNDAREMSDDYGPVFASRANADLCSPDDNWLLAGPDDPDSIDAAIADHRRTRELGYTDASVLVMESWVHLLQALEDPTPETAALRDALRRAQTAEADLTRMATAGADSEGEQEKMPSLHFARFNVALAHLALDDGEAEAAYRSAIHCLEPEAGCAGGGIAAPDLRTYYDLAALNDLELLPDPRAARVDHYRELIMGRGEAPPDAGSAAPASRWEALAFSQELQVATTDESDPDAAVVWFFRRDAADPWEVIYVPSYLTATVGSHLNVPKSTQYLLPAGHYRADVYVDGRVSHTKATTFTGSEGQKRVVAPDLGLSAVVPNDWKPDVRQKGVETAFVAFAPHETGEVVLRREEGRWPDGDIAQWLKTTLDDWVTDVAGAGAADDGSDEPADAWYLGPELTLTRTYPQAGVRAAIGFWPYAAGQPACGGTLFMTMISGHQDPASVQHALVLEDYSKIEALTCGPSR